VKHILFISLSLIFGTTTFCQTGVLSGTVRDAESNTPLDLATISILNPDTSLITYKLSDKDGKFLIDKLPLRKKLLISVTYTGYIGHYSTTELFAGKRDTLNILLAFNNKDTNAVVVTTKVPIRMNGDTLEINPGAFKLKEDAVVEELLNQVSGVTIWSDGTITVNGKKVQSLLVDGKPFLGSSDTRVATQNLPKSAIDKIQLYQEYDRSNINQQARPQDSLLTMNIKLKESSKKGYFGKVGFGYGTRERFESDLSFQVYNKKSSLGVGGGFNNINKNIGNLQEMFQNNTYRNYNPNLYNVGRFGTSGINKNHSFGSVFTHSFIEEANSRQNNRLAVTYNKQGTDTYITDVNLQNRTLLKNTQVIRDNGVQNNQTDRHDLNINYVKTNSYNDNLNINSVVNRSTEGNNSTRFTEVRDSADALKSTNTSASTQQRQSDIQSLDLNFAKNDRENPIAGFNFRANARRSNTSTESDTKSLFESFIDRSKNTSFNRHYSTNNSTLNAGGTIDYAGFKRLLFGRYNLFGINLNLSQRLNYTSQTDKNRVTDFDSTAKLFVKNTNLTYENKKQLFEYSPSLLLTKNIWKYTELFYRSIYFQFTLLDDIVSEKNSSTIAQRNIDRSFQFLRYQGNVSYQYTKQQKYQYYANAGYTKNFEYPAIDQLYTIVDDINVYNIRIGNPKLRNRVNHSINVYSNFNTQKPQAKYSFNGNINGTYTKSFNPIADSTINDSSGRRISYLINADKSSSVNLNYYFNISRKFKKNALQLMYDGRYNTGRTPNYIDRVYNISETNGLYNNFNLQFSLNTLLVLNVGETIQHYKTKQSAGGLASFKNANNITKFGVVVNPSANLTFSSTVDHINNSNLNKPTVLWNAFATYRFMKQQGELKLSSMDMLRQYKNITNNASADGTQTRITNGLQQFFLLTFSYYPRKFGKTELKKQTAKETVY
jgi:hypothetical protein